MNDPLRQGRRYRDERGLARLLVDDVENIGHRMFRRVRLRPAGEPLGDGIQTGRMTFGIRGQHPVADGVERDGEILLAGAQSIMSHP